MERLEYGSILPHSLDSRHSTHIPSTLELTVAAIHRLSVNAKVIPSHCKDVIRACTNEQRIASNEDALGSIDKLGFYEKCSPIRLLYSDWLYSNYDNFQSCVCMYHF